MSTEVLGQLAIRWVRNADGSPEYQVAAEGQAERDPLWTAGELHRIAAQLAGCGWPVKRTIPPDPAAPPGSSRQVELAAGSAYRITGPDTVEVPIQCLSCRQVLPVQVQLHGERVLDAIARSSRSFLCPECAE